jgi:hypothetical protein
MNLSELTKEQRTALIAELEAENKAERERILRDREAYRQSKDEVILETFRDLSDISDQMLYLKGLVFEKFETVIQVKDELFCTKSDRMTDTFTTEDGRITIKLGNRLNEGWGDTIEVGVAKVKGYLKTLAKDDNSADLVDTVMGLLAKDRKGNLKASRVLELEKLAKKSGNEDFIDGINIIRDAYRPSPTCRFIEVRYKDEDGRERALPLSMSAIDVNK